ncbi:MAG: hypothetical protein L6262_04080 [Weeksellaceae bacterium]|nr:hypothetical protein [Weeksellaceae bacterium]
MKNLFKFVSLLVIVWGTFAFGQVTKQEKLYSIPVPTAMKSEYSKEGYIKSPADFYVITDHPGFTIIFDKTKKMVSIEASKTIYDQYIQAGATDVEAKVPPCAKNCENKPTDFGVVLCLYNCALEAFGL